ncbi:MAG: HAD family phosphatase [Spirochaetaceae bacterium]|nr:HAD family phosphatase [Spirochaetaceae bacterium]
MEIKLILCDLDGTLLRSDKTISDKSVQVLEQCRSNGILIGFSTSRGRANIIPFEAKINPDIIICNGGASMVCRGKLIYTKTFTLEETRRMLAAAYKVCGDNAEITLDTLDSIYWNRKNDKSTDYDWNSDYDDFRDFKEPAMKICVQTDDKDTAQKIAASVPGCDMLPFSDIPWYKFSAANATKEAAISFLCEYLKITPQNVIAFGDDHNDIGMLKMCGTGVAMGNAIAEVKAVADALTITNDEDGVARFLEKL